MKRQHKRQQSGNNIERDNLKNDNNIQTIIIIKKNILGKHIN